MVSSAGIPGSPANLALIDFSLPSHHTTASTVVAEYARPSFPAGRSPAEAAST